MAKPFKQIDVFTDRLGFGNPLAVVLGADDLDDATMARFASWTNLSETTFVCAPTEPGADYRLRIFTPNQELPFAGHPTIGSCHAWLEHGGRPANEDRIVQECGIGNVELRYQHGRLAFATPAPLRSGPVEASLGASVIADLGLDPSQVVDMAWADNGPGWIGVLVTDVEILRGMTPAWTRDEISAGVAALLEPEGEGSPSLEVRAFFAASGTREDPVTGSLNGSLAQWLVGNGTLATPYVAAQGAAMGRNGRVHVSQDESGALWIGGDAVTGVHGQVELDRMRTRMTDT